MTLIFNLVLAVCYSYYIVYWVISYNIVKPGIKLKMIITYKDQNYILTLILLVTRLKFHQHSFFFWIKETFVCILVYIIGWNSIKVNLLLKWVLKGVSTFRLFKWVTPHFIESRVDRHLLSHFRDKLTLVELFFLL